MTEILHAVTRIYENQRAKSGPFSIPATALQPATTFLLTLYMRVTIIPIEIR
jgi:hypothetical protein